MIKFNTGSWIGDRNGGKKPIIVTSKLPCKFINLVIGTGIILAGTGYLMLSAFKTGALGYETAEYKTLNSLGYLHDAKEDV